MAAETRFTGISLEGDPQAPERGLLKVKLFYEPDGVDPDEYEDWYAEAYVNVDLAAGRLWFAEKSEEYRLPLVRALGGILPPGTGAT